MRPARGNSGPAGEPYGRLDTNKLRERFVRQTAERVNLIRDLHCGLLRLRHAEARIFMDELRGMFLSDLSSRRREDLPPSS
jgi:hypothetical protein